MRNLLGMSVVSVVSLIALVKVAQGGIPGSCPPGTFNSTDGNPPCTDCSAGTFSSGFGSLMCTSCSPGRFSAASGATVCTNCGAGTFSASSGASTCTDCTPGKFNAASGASACTNCDVGTFSDAAASTTCTDCTAGTFNASMGAATCADCGVGTYSAAAASTTCTNCIPGTFNGSMGAAACASCGAGTYSAAAASTTCTDCSAGSFNDSAGSTACTNCGVGSYSAASASTTCTDCSPGTFNDSVGASGCTSCALGKFSAASASTTCASCTPGTFNGFLGASECMDCTADTFSSVAAATTCTDCASGTFNSTQAATECVDEPIGRTCARAIALQTRLLATKNLTIFRSCRDRVASGKLVCQSNQCVINPSSMSPVTVSGSSCTVDADCCLAYDKPSSTATSQARIARAEASAAKAIMKACSLNKGTDGKKGTADDTFVDPHLLGFSSTCPDLAGNCGSIATTALVNPGIDNDLIDCSACVARALATVDLGFSFPLGGGTGAPEVACEQALGLQSSKLEVYELTKLQLCHDRVASQKLVCQSNQCVLNPLSKKPVTVSGSSCSVAADCCPAFDNATPTKTTQAKLASYAGKVATAIKKGCSTANGPDGKKGTDDDTYTDPQSLGFGSSCLACSIGIDDMVLPGTNNDLVDCVQCTQQSVASGIVSLFSPLVQ